MRQLKLIITVTTFLFLLISCSKHEIVKSPLNDSGITIKPYALTKHEQELIQKTGVQNIEYFILNGSVKESDDLLFKVEFYKNGIRQEESLLTSQLAKKNFRNKLISFGVSQNSVSEPTITLLAGDPDGIVSTNRENQMSASSFGSLLNEKIKLKKGEPVYLAAWIGTTKNYLEGISMSTGTVPEAIKKAELAFVYKVTLINKKHE